MSCRRVSGEISSDLGGEKLRPTDLAMRWSARVFIRRDRLPRSRDGVFVTRDADAGCEASRNNNNKNNSVASDLIGADWDRSSLRPRIPMTRGLLATPRRVTWRAVR